jgi:hypothetical protein
MRPDGPAYVEEVHTLVRAHCPVCQWNGPNRDLDQHGEIRRVRDDVNDHNRDHELEARRP